MRFYVISLSIYSVALTALVIMLMIQNRSLKDSMSSPEPQRVDFSDIKQPDLQDVPIIGNPEAPITIVTFSDFECSACVQGSKIMYQLLDEYPYQIKIAFKNSPSPRHTSAPGAASAALAAYRQGKFWEMEKLLFENQARLGDELYYELADQIGLDMEAFRNLSGHQHWEGYLATQVAEARAFEITGTPTYFINGVKVTGASYETLSRVIKHFLQNES